MVGVDGGVFFGVDGCLALALSEDVEGGLVDVWALWGLDFGGVDAMADDFFCVDLWH